MKKSFNIQELLHRKSKRHETKAMHLSSSRAFQRDQELDLKHPSLVELISHMLKLRSSFWGLSNFKPHKGDSFIKFFLPSWELWSRTIESLKPYSKSCNQQRPREGPKLGGKMLEEMIRNIKNLENINHEHCT